MQNIGVIDQFNLPAGFTAGQSQRNAIGNSWKFSFHPGGDERVEITAYQRGNPLSEADCRAFRAVLADEPSVLINLDDSNQGLVSASSSKTDAASKLLLSLGESLGNAGNNQFVNLAEGLRGPQFHLSRLAVRLIQNRKVLEVEGRFHRSGMVVPPAPEGGEADKNDGTYYYRGIFIDAGSGLEDEPGQVEELLLQADTRSLFANYQSQFEAMLQSISWRK